MGWEEELTPENVRGSGWSKDSWWNVLHPRYDRTQPYEFKALADALTHLRGPRQFSAAGEWAGDIRDAITQLHWTVSRAAIHQATRVYWSLPDGERTLGRRMIAAFLGGQDDILPFITDTVKGLLNAGEGAVFLPIVADALQDAGMPETHPILARCRDSRIPFMLGEWLHRLTAAGASQ